MLNLQCDSNPEWVRAAIDDLDVLLSDHVHCEKKAAAAALSFINRYPGRTALVSAMTVHAREELEHFDRVHDVLRGRQSVLLHDTPDPYVNRLLALIRKGEPQRELDSLICAALIEARSCERFQLLIDALPPCEERRLFEELMPSEARHYAMFMEHARTAAGAAETDRRLGELATLEADIVRALPNEARMHG
ncbi:MAG: tRNA-(ms[2]io[6]A)-hydroxylase [Bacteroidia bacterium]|nr:tRNA-(ms[2]io[6]A)-hydroxylase [Bacteroidia bacterium]